MDTASISRRLRRSLLVVVVPVFCTLAQPLVPFDADSSVFILDRAFEREHRIFGEEGFHDARIFFITDSTYALELTVRSLSGFRRTTRELTAQDLEWLRTRVALARRAATVRSDSAEPVQTDGSRMFVQTFTGLGLSWYGLTIPAIIGGGSSSAVLGVYFLTAGGSYLFSDGYASSRSISVQEGRAFQYFATRGIAHGYALSGLIMGTDMDHRVAIPVATLTSLAEGFTAMGLAADGSWSEGRLNALGAYGDAGLLLGIATGYLADPGDSEILDDIGRNPRRYSATFLTLGGLGLLTGSWISSRVSYEPGDAAVQESIGYLGAAAGFTLVDLGSDPSRNAQILGTSLGFIAGHAWGALIADRRRLSSESGNSVRLLTSGGILLGLGITQIVSAEGTGRTAYIGAATLGGALGLMYSLSRERDIRSDDSMSGVDVRFHPEGILAPVGRVEGSPLSFHRPIVTLTVTR